MAPDRAEHEPVNAVLLKLSDTDPAATLNLEDVTWSGVSE
jgi:hypothetical protein